MQSALKEDPFTGTVFVFRAKRADRLKILFWDDEADQETVRGTVSPTNGLVMAYKRLEETTFAWPTIQNGVLTLNRIRPVSARFQVFSACQFQGMSSSMRLIL